jgi:hypothetical protein
MGIQAPSRMDRRVASRIVREGYAWRSGEVQPAAAHFDAERPRSAAEFPDGAVLLACACLSLDLSSSLVSSLSLMPDIVNE